MSMRRSVAWKPFYLRHIIRLERIRRRFVGSRLGMSYAEVPVEDLMKQLGLSQLEVCRDFADLAFLFRHLHGATDRPYLLLLISL